MGERRVLSGGVLYDASMLASGTVASLTGQRHYEVLDRVQAAFLAWVERALEAGDLAEDARWQDAWVAFAGQGDRDDRR